MNLKQLRNYSVILFSGAILAISGCGGSSGGVVPVLSAAASNECVDCHATNSKSISTTSGVKITEQWLLSTHNTAKGAGCMDCHSYAHFHKNVTSCRSCHATAHSNRGSSCTLCHGGGSKETADCNSCHQNIHSIANMSSTSCIRCHGGTNPYDATVVMKNPDIAGKCFGCHNGGKYFRRYTAVTIKHFNIYTGTTFRPANYVTVNYRNACTSCHEPHNPLKGLGSTERKSWAKSKHGNVKGVAWATIDFKNTFDLSTGSYACIRCHTATGFINFIDGGMTSPFPGSTWASPTDGDRETLTCRACHTSGNFKGSVRKVSQFIAPYGYSGGTTKAPLVYPDVGKSNLCIPCHSGRENGIAIKKTISDFSNASFKNPHYLAAAAVFYGIGGFQFYSSTKQTTYAPQAYTSRYGVIADGTIIPASAASISNSTPAIVVGDTLSGEKAPWSHGKLGMNNFQSTKDTAIIAEKGSGVFTGNNGQCVTCHLGSGTKPGLHSLNAFEVAKGTWTTSFMGCYGCHTTENMQITAEGERLLVDRALAFFRYELLLAGTEFINRFPYFYQVGTTTPTTNWSGLLPPNNNGGANMGAAMNFVLLTKEKGVHVHNRTYMKQLIFDSIQHLQKGKVSFSNRYISTGAVADPNSLINFANYSSYLTANPDNILNNAETIIPPRTAVPGTGNGVLGQPISISQLKRYLTRYNTSAPTTGLFTRP